MREHRGGLLQILLNPQNQPSEPLPQGWNLRCTYISQVVDDLNAISLQHDQAVSAAQDRPGRHKQISNIAKTSSHNVSRRSSARVVSIIECLP